MENEIRIPVAYEGDKPYIFISYAHKDSARVLPLIAKMQDAGLRVWFDKGIEAGSEWPEYIEEHLMRADSVVVFLSESSVASLNCRNEINLAFAEKKKLLAVYLEKTELRHGMRLQLSSVQSLFAYEKEEDSALVEELRALRLLAPAVEDTESAKGLPHTPREPKHVPPLPNVKRSNRRAVTVALASVFIAVLLSLLIPSLFRTGDVSDDLPSDLPTQTTPPPTVESGILTVGVSNENYYPYAYVEGAEIKGIEIEILIAISRELGLDVSFSTYDFEELLPLVENGEADCVIGLEETTARNEIADPSNVIFTANRREFILYLRKRNPELCDAINEAIEKLLANGTVTRILADYEG